MKKIFTLAAIAMVAMGANAQTESYSAISSDGTLATEFASIVDENGVATNAADGKSIVNFGTTNVEGQAVGGTTPADALNDGVSKENGTHVDMDGDGTVHTWNDIKWGKGNRGDISYWWVTGTGNPYVTTYVDTIKQDGQYYTYFDANNVEHQSYRLFGTTYTPGSNEELPVQGLYYKFTTKAAGTLVLKLWVNKNQSFFVVDNDTKKLVAYTADGYINGQNENGTMKHLTNEQIDSIHHASLIKYDSETKDSIGMNDENYRIGAGNQPFFGNITIATTANKTYWVFLQAGQIGFNGFDFTAGAADGISTVSNQKAADKNAPIFNLAGQRVSKAYKGVVIQNGRKFLQK